MKKLKTILTSLLTIIMCFSVLKIQPKAYDYIPRYINFTHGQMQQGIYVQSADSLLDVSAGVINSSINEVSLTSVLEFTFDKYYSGTVQLNWTYDSTKYNKNINDWNIIVSGGKIDSVTPTSGKIVFRVYDRDSFTVTMQTSNVDNLGANSDPYFQFTSATSSLTAVTNHNNESDNIKSIDTRLTTANTTLDSISSKLTTANGYYVDILANTNDIESYLAQLTDSTVNTLIETQLTNIGNYTSSIATTNLNCNTLLSTINNTMSSIETDLAVLSNIDSTNEDILTALNGISTNISTISNNQTALNTSVSNIYTALGTVTQNQTSIINSLTSIGADLSSIATTIASVNATSANIYSAIISMKTTLEGYEQYIDNIEGLISDQNTLITNLNSTLDTITWNNLSLSGNLYWSNELTGDQTKWYSTDTPTNTYKKIYIYFKGYQSSLEQIDKLELVLYNNSNYQDMNIKFMGYINGSSFIRYENINVYSSYNRYRTMIYFYDKKLSIGSNYNVIEVSSGNYYTKLEMTSQNNTFKYINSNNVDYWNLISYFNQYNEFNRVYNILSAIQENQIDYSTYIDSIETLLQNLNNAQHDYSSILNNIENEVDGVEELLGILTAALSLEGAGIFAEIGVGVSTIVSALTVTDAATGVTKTIWDWLKDILDMSSDIADITDNIDTAIGNVINSITRIDTLIDTISWDNVVNYNIYWSNELTADQTKWYQTNTPLNEYNKIYIYINNLPSSTEQIDKLDLVLYNNTNYTEMNVDYIGIINNSSVVRTYNTDIYTNYSRYHTYIYLFDQDISSGNIYNILEVTADNRFISFEIENTSNTIQYLTSNDIEYWNLISYFNQYQTNKQMLKGLLIDVDTETSITQYNRDHETVTQIESNLTTLFNQTQPYVDSQLAPLDNQTFFDKLSNNSKLFDYIFRGVFDTDDSLEVSGTVTNPIFLLVIFAGVFLALVG